MSGPVTKDGDARRWRVWPHQIFDFCRQLGITPYINMTRSRGIRTIAVLDQLGGGITDPAKFAHLAKDERESNHKKWKECVQYGQRWLVEIII